MLTPEIRINIANFRKEDKGQRKKPTMSRRNFKRVVYFIVVGSATALVYFVYSNARMHSGTEWTGGVQNMRIQGNAGNNVEDNGAGKLQDAVGDDILGSIGDGVEGNLKDNVRDKIRGKIKDSILDNIENNVDGGDFKGNFRDNIRENLKDVQNNIRDNIQNNAQDNNRGNVPENPNEERQQSDKDSNIHLHAAAIQAPERVANNRNDPPILQPDDNENKVIEDRGTAAAAGLQELEKAAEDVHDLAGNLAKGLEAENKTNDEKLDINTNNSVQEIDEHPSSWTKPTIPPELIVRNKKGEIIGEKHLPFGLPEYLKNRSQKKNISDVNLEDAKKYKKFVELKTFDNFLAEQREKQNLAAFQGRFLQLGIDPNAQNNLAPNNAVGENANNLRNINPFANGNIQNQQDTNPFLQGKGGQGVANPLAGNLAVPQGANQLLPVLNVNEWKNRIFEKPNEPSANDFGALKKSNEGAWGALGKPNLLRADAELQPFQELPLQPQQQLQQQPLQQQPLQQPPLQQQPLQQQPLQQQPLQQQPLQQQPLQQQPLQQQPLQQQPLQQQPLQQQPLQPQQQLDQQPLQQQPLQQQPLQQQPVEKQQGLAEQQASQDVNSTRNAQITCLDFRFPTGLGKLCIPAGANTAAAMTKIQQDVVNAADLLNQILLILSSDSTLGFIDVGAGIGEFSISAALLMRAVIAVEPLKINHQLLLRTASENQVTHRIKLLEAALDSEAYVGLAKPAADPESYGEVQVSRLWATNITDDSNTVKVTTLNKIVADVPFRRAVLRLGFHGGVSDNFLDSSNDFFREMEIPYIITHWPGRKKADVATQTTAILAKLGYKPSLTWNGPETALSAAQTDPKFLVWRKVSS